MCLSPSCNTVILFSPSPKLYGTLLTYVTTNGISSRCTGTPRSHCFLPSVVFIVGWLVWDSNDLIWCLQYQNPRSGLWWVKDLFSVFLELQLELISESWPREHSQILNLFQKQNQAKKMPLCILGNGSSWWFLIFSRLFFFLKFSRAQIVPHAIRT